MNPYDYSTAADYARLSGYHRTTIVELIKQGRVSAVNKTVKSRKKNIKKHWKIAHKDMLRPIKKQHPKQGRTWNSTEIYVLRNNIGLKASVLSKMIGRNENSIKVMKCKLRKQ